MSSRWEMVATQIAHGWALNGPSPGVACRFARPDKAPRCECLSFEVCSGFQGSELGPRKNHFEGSKSRMLWVEDMVSLE